jgi:putative redox protein
MANITATLTFGMRVSMSNGRHEWLADEPIALGGSDSGPNPYELLLASLAACTCITLSYYCKRKGIALESVNASYDFDRVHADDSENCDDPKSGFIDRISSHVEIKGDFDEAQRQRLAEIVERCPVHKTLAKGVTFSDHATFS